LLDSKEVDEEALAEADRKVEEARARMAEALSKLL